MASYGINHHQSMSCPSSVTGDAGVLFLAVINALFTNQCQLGNREDYPPDAGPSLVENDSFDYIIVGGGTAGSVVASNLAKLTQDRVLLLEAGGYPSPTSDIPALHPSTQKTSEDWQFHTEKSNVSCLSYKNQRCLWPSGKVLGGTSTINSLLYIRGSKQSFNNWAEQGNLGWSYHDALPFFKKSERLEENDLKAAKQYGADGMLPLTKTKSRDYQLIRNGILNSAKELGHKVHSHEDRLGFFEALQTIRHGVRKNAAIFLADHEALPNLKVSTDSLVEKVLIDSDLKEANGVQVNIAGRRLNLFAEKEVIISAGPVNSPKLLMLSGIGPKQHLGSLGINVINDLKVGENLQDHLMYPLLAVKIGNSTMKYLQQNPTDELYKYFASREGSLANTGISNIVGLLSTSNHSINANVKLNYVFIPHQDNYFLSQYKKNLNTNEEVIKSLAEFNRHSHLLMIHITLMECKSKGSIRLKSKNPYEKPLIDAGYLSDKKDIDELLKSIKIVEKQIETPSFRKLSAQIVDIDIPNCRQHKFKSDDYWRCAIINVATSGHAVTGSCKMGLSIDPDAVVDPLLKVHGVGKLRVIDSSILPSNTNGDLAATAMMIGQKGSNIIVKGFKGINHI